MEASQKHGDTLASLSRTGTRIAIDDFGTGYSSLQYLTVFPVSRLKIAQDLVFRVTDDCAQCDGGESGRSTGPRTWYRGHRRRCRDGSAGGFPAGCRLRTRTGLLL